MFIEELSMRMVWSKASYEFARKCIACRSLRNCISFLFPQQTMILELYAPSVLSPEERFPIPCQHQVAHNVVLLTCAGRSITQEREGVFDLDMVEILGLTSPEGLSKSRFQDEASRRRVLYSSQSPAIKLAICCCQIMLYWHEDPSQSLIGPN